MKERVSKITQSAGQAPRHAGSLHRGGLARLLVFQVLQVLQVTNARRCQLSEWRLVHELPRRCAPVWPMARAQLAKYLSAAVTLPPGGAIDGMCLGTRRRAKMMMCGGPAIPRNNWMFDRGFE